MADYLNFVERIGSSTPVQTFENGKNCIIKVNKDYENIYNNIIVLGYGKGDNQVKATASDSTSISNYGQRDYTITDFSIRDATTAQLIADSMLALMKEPKTTIEIEWFLGTTQLIARRGDAVTIIDSINNINGTYRIFSINYESESKIMLHAMEEGSIAPMNLQEFLKDLKFEDLTQSNYAFGTTIKTSEIFVGDAKGGGGDPDNNSCYFRFKTPNPSGSINSAVLNITTVQMEANYHTSAISDPTHSHTINATGTSSAAAAGNAIGGIAAAETLIDTFDTSWTGAHDTFTVSDEDTGLSILHIRASIDNLDGNSSVTFYWGLHDGSTVYTKNSSITFNATNKYIPLMIIFDENLRGKTLRLVTKSNVTYSVEANLDIEYTVSIVGQHSHTISIRTTTSENTGVSPSNEFTKIADTDTPATYDVYLGVTSSNPDDDKSASWESSATHIGTYSDRYKEIDITQYLNKNTNYTIKFKPSSTKMMVSSQIFYELKEDDI